MGFKYAKKEEVDTSAVPTERAQVQKNPEAPSVFQQFLDFFPQSDDRAQAAYEASASFGPMGFGTVFARAAAAKVLAPKAKELCKLYGYKLHEIEFVDVSSARFRGMAAGIRSFLTAPIGQAPKGKAELAMTFDHTFHSYLTTEWERVAAVFIEHGLLK